ncbi:MAG: hypothetical protein ACD_3C00193G0005 [uncultured bacterium (gcode 4)]|uniref:Uncharacterized protein n=1 Tax=uncultured bacterium (gcode 4) TaxID=1234023 RepID=K2G070_9BACT|nr:MAG: hypothetical protein ACD_3C00193G0005 [uncultured bacterium (gcode 4)]
MSLAEVINTFSWIVLSEKNWKVSYRKVVLDTSRKVQVVTRLDWSRYFTVKK